MTSFAFRARHPAARHRHRGLGQQPPLHRDRRHRRDPGCHCGRRSSSSRCSIRWLGTLSARLFGSPEGEAPRSARDRRLGPWSPRPPCWTPLFPRHRCPSPSPRREGITEMTKPLSGPWAGSLFVAVLTAALPLAGGYGRPRRCAAPGRGPGGIPLPTPGGQGDRQHRVVAAVPRPGARRPDRSGPGPQLEREDRRRQHRGGRRRPDPGAGPALPPGRLQRPGTARARLRGHRHPGPKYHCQSPVPVPDPRRGLMGDRPVGGASGVRAKRRGPTCWLPSRPGAGSSCPWWERWQAATSSSSGSTSNWRYPRKPRPPTRSRCTCSNFSSSTARSLRWPWPRPNPSTRSPAPRSPAWNARSPRPKTPCRSCSVATRGPSRAA